MIKIKYKNDVVVYSYKISNFLLNNGYKLKKINPNKNAKGYLCFIFEYNEKIQEELEIYKKIYID